MKNNLKTRWSVEDLNKMKEYIMENSQELISNLLVNIVVGYMRFRKHRRFFINMGNKLKRDSKICKAKFQKIERMMYIDVLNVSVRYYELFCFIRRQKAESVNYDFKNCEEFNEKFVKLANEKQVGSFGKSKFCF